MLFQTIQFSISTKYSSILPIDTTLSGSKSTGLSVPGSDRNKGVLLIPQFPALQDPPHQSVQCYVQDTSWGVLTFCGGSISIFNRLS